MFRNTFNANAKYPLRDCENLSSPIENQLPLKPKAFSGSFVPFLEHPSNFKYFEKKDDRHSYFISEITDCQRLWSDHSPKNTVSEHPFTVNVLKCP